MDAHINCGIRHIAWELGRSVLRYHSDLPGATCAGSAENLNDLGAQARAIAMMYRERCQLRAALGYGKKKELVIYGRLCMNRHYRPGSDARSAFAQNHPEWCEVRKDGWMDPTRLCYAIPEYRQERVAILREVVEIGCEGVLLDFCRQPPVVRYHPALVTPYRQRTGKDPRMLSWTEKEDFLHWCRHRADSVTEFLKELKNALDPIRERYNRRIPVQARVPDDGFEANLIAGLDVVRWCREGLVDELALSELRWLAEYQEWDDKPYIQLGKETGIPVYAGSNCLPVQPPKRPGARGWGGQVNPSGVNPLVLAKRALRSLEAGAQGISLYQSDTGVRWPGMPEVLRALGDEKKLREIVEDKALIAAYPITPENRDFGIDNHSRSRSALRFRASAGEEACGV